MAVPPVARIMATPGWRISAWVTWRVGRRGTAWTRSGQAPCQARTWRSRSAVWAPTPAASRWQLAMSVSRALMQIRALNTSVATGLVTGIRPTMAPIGSPISVSPSRPLPPATPMPGLPVSDGTTPRLANRFLTALSGTQPRPVSATVAAASSSAWAAICAASAPIRASIWSSAQPTMPSRATPDRATSASTAGSGSSAKIRRSPSPARRGPWPGQDAAASPASLSSPPDHCRAPTSRIGGPSKWRPSLDVLPVTRTMRRMRPSSPP